MTKRQFDLLKFIVEYMEEHDHCPSFDQMKEAVGLRSKSGIHRMIKALVERGYLEQRPHRARAIRVRSIPSSLLKPIPPDQFSHDMLMSIYGKSNQHPVHLMTEALGRLGYKEGVNIYLAHFLKEDNVL